jgi:hypothetical protein
MSGGLQQDQRDVQRLRAALSQNQRVLEVLERAAALDLPQWYLTAGCLFQKVWNVVTGRPAEHGIRDYDLFYFNAADLSWEAEDAVIRAADRAFADVPVVVEVRNEARVHLWYEARFGVPCQPFRTTEDAIDAFAATTCCLGARLLPNGEWQVYAPHGTDVFDLVPRPNPVLAPEDVYRQKAKRWQRQWPELQVIEWPRIPTER